ncbi:MULTISPECIES: DUF2231 domain-containing protein [Halomonas]|uniref:DUF2231 domain-containing protein n=1 Tax=Halomonas chromatireducens TaxID=507626 RepID=A0A109UNF8_9GAMM|nr:MULTISPECIES: DUF2231 domain-containing protein [Halomonas]AMD02649.1 hypothetical protein LOKO_03609 [Halomonas chromatireducens]MBZ0329595.1 hypothetical protein [Halomonas sp. ANAO-440]
MAAMHHMLVHFPLAFWSLSILMILLGALAKGHIAELSRAALLPVLAISVLSGLVAIVSGLIVWPMQANITSPLARNHILMAFWSLGIFTMLTVLVWRAGDSAFEGSRRWALVILALTGGLMFAAAGTLGGHMLGEATPWSAVLGLLGWNVYTTYYTPYWVLLLMLLAGLGGIYLWLRASGRLEPGKATLR